MHRCSVSPKKGKNKNIESFLRENSRSYRLSAVPRVRLTNLRCGQSITLRAHTLKHLNAYAYTNLTRHAPSLKNLLQVSLHVGWRGSRTFTRMKRQTTFRSLDWFGLSPHFRFGRSRDLETAVPRCLRDVARRDSELANREHLQVFSNLHEYGGTCSLFAIVSTSDALANTRIMLYAYMYMCNSSHVSTSD